MPANTSLIVPENDLSFMLQQTESDTNTMIAGMLSLINANESLNEGLQNQSWCKRMFNTILGKNKATAAEIRENHDKLNAYVVQAVGELYNRNKICSQIMVSLGLQITQLYNSHLELKSMLYALTSKLNEKIESVDNYHTLLQEIDEGIYGDEPNISGLLSVISQIDSRMISDSKKMQLLERKLSNKGLLTEKYTLSIKDFVFEITNMLNDNLGIVYADLQLYQSEYIIVDLAIDAIELWNLLPAANRKVLKKQTIIDKILSEAGVDDSVEISMYEIYDEIVALRRDLFDNAAMSSFDDDCDEEDDDYDDADECGEDDVYDEDDDNIECGSDDTISELISNMVEFYLDLEDINYVTHTGYISRELREKAKEHIVDKSPSAPMVGAVAGFAVGGLVGAIVGKKIGDQAVTKQQITCDADDIIAIVDSSVNRKCKEGMVFTQYGVFFSETGSSSVYIPYANICTATGTKGFLGGKLTIERYEGSDFVWESTLIPKHKVADLLRTLSAFITAC